MTTIFWQDGQRIKIEFTSLSLIIHAGMFLTDVFLGGLDECLPKFMQLTAIITDGNSYNLFISYCYQSIPVAVLRILAFYQ